MKTGGTLPAAMNAANEIAVEAFLGDKIRLSDIPKIIEGVMDAHETLAAANLEIVLQTDVWARQFAEKISVEKSVAAGLT